MAKANYVYVATEGDDFLYNQNIIIHGLGGNDQIINDVTTNSFTMYGDDGNDWLAAISAKPNDLYSSMHGGRGTDLLQGSSEYDRLEGDEDNDLLEGGVGNLNGPKLGTYVTGNDILRGGSGTDGLYGYDGNDDLDGGDGDDGPNAAYPDGKVTISVYIGNTVTFDAGLYGGEGNDELNGRAGADRMVGGSGDDIYYVDNVGDTVIEAAGEGTDTVEISNSSSGPYTDTYTLSDNVENLRLTSYGSSIRIAIGNALANVIDGSLFKETLDGKAGDDVLRGHEDDDTYIIDSSGDTVVELSAEGTDSVKATISYALGANVENLMLTGSGDIFGTGNALANVIEGNSGINILSGQGGDDTLVGGKGNDTLHGGAGSDTAVYTGKRSEYTITIATNSSVLTVTDKRTGAVNQGTDTLAAIEKLEFSDGTIVAPVNQAPTSLTLTAASVTENADLKTTIGIFSAVDPENGKLTYKLTDDADGLFVLSGNRLITAKNIDYEEVQKDTVTVSVSDGVHAMKKTFTISIQDALEKIMGTTAGDTLNGGIGADKIVAGAGNDTLYGGKSFDDLYGGAGKDMFVFKALSDFGVSKTKTDTIFDFSHKEGDRIGLSAIDASIKSSANNAFSFIGTDIWHKEAGELRYTKTTSDTYVYGDVDGDGKADFALHLDDPIKLNAGDFIL